jgi:hypothetical protein
MRFLFLDNFRGFSNSLVPIKDVNFLVGENSTGKTSLLTMLRILSNPPSYMGFTSAGGEEVPAFGHFNEMVSAHSPDRSYFRIGLIGDSRGTKREKSAGGGILLTYTELAGLPKLSQFTSIAVGREISIRFEAGKTYYKNTPAALGLPPNKLSERLQAWALLHASATNSEWAELKGMPEQFKADQIPIFMLLGMVSTQNNKKASAYPMLFPDTGPQVIWIAPIRSKPKRTYDEPNTPFSPEGSHTPYLIRRILNSKKDAAGFKRFMEDVGRSSGLFQKIEIKHFGDATDTSPFEVDAYVDGKALSVAWLGYGVSQSLPILVEVIDRPKHSLFAIQQPEVHLHPRAQASLGDVFFEMSVRDKKTFLVETHSDFTIDRFRMNYRKKKGRLTKKSEAPTSQVLFFERHEHHNTVTPISIGPRGELPSDQPDGYRHFFIKEEMDLLGL